MGLDQQVKRVLKALELRQPVAFAEMLCAAFRSNDLLADGVLSSGFLSTSSNREGVQSPHLRGLLSCSDDEKTGLGNRGGFGEQKSWALDDADLTLAETLWPPLRERWERKDSTMQCNAN